jgi:TRAP-type C4-dicarboxylate transport system permease small subunit
MKRGFDLLVKVLLYVPMTALVAMLCVEVGNIIGRPMGLPIHGSVELTSYLGAIFVAICIFYTTLRQSNVAVGLLASKISGRPRSILDAGVSLVGIVTALLLAWATSVHARKMSLEGERSLLLRLNTPVIRYVFAFGLLLVAVALAITLYRAVAKKVKKWTL